MDSLLNTSTSPTDDITENAPKICKTIRDFTFNNNDENYEGKINHAPKIYT